MMTWNNATLSFRGVEVPIGPISYTNSRADSRDATAPAPGTYTVTFKVDMSPAEARVMLARMRLDVAHVLTENGQELSRQTRKLLRKDRRLLRGWHGRWMHEAKRPRLKHISPSFVEPVDP